MVSSLSEDESIAPDVSVVIVDSSPRAITTDPATTALSPPSVLAPAPATSPIAVEPLSSSQPTTLATPATRETPTRPATSTVETIARLLAELDSDDDDNRVFAQVPATPSPPKASTTTSKSITADNNDTTNDTIKRVKAATITTRTRAPKRRAPTTPPRKRPTLSSSPPAPAVFTDPISSSPTPLPPPLTPPTTAAATVAPAPLSPYSGPGAEYVLAHPTPAQLQEANRISRSKEELLGQMTLYFPHSVYNGFDKPALAHHFPGDRMATYTCELPLLYWRRRAKCVWDERRRQFLACRPFDIDESVAVLFYNADDFVDKLTTDTLQDDVTAAKQTYPELIVFVEGLDLIYRRIRKLVNAHHRADMLDKMGEKSTRPKEPIPSYTVDDIVHKINALQHHHRVNVFSVNSHQEVGEWLALLTVCVAERYYGASKDPRGGAHVKSGSDSESTFVSAMMQFRMVTRKKAQSLYSAFPSLQKVYDQLRIHGSIGVDSEDKNIVPPSVDRMMLKFFTADDPSTPVME
ncbi:hypothetical protein DIURU_002933 [Diutina rugosa]|uniref:ERCC4 domain-containing protein n=1 Tax=Diutina rugosa TaxID=5481 RepID=A0A642UUI6_DIURU|nr:uncharacterized protein DIURU_002933 [Diutina rugosa]KAA8902139.1 hypothetical protein DIURU_002933 [Diutina rugosa]